MIADDVFVNYSSRHLPHSRTEIPLKTESGHDDNFIATFGHNDNLRCHQLRQSWHHNDS